MTRRAQHSWTLQPVDARAPASAPLLLFIAGAAGIMLLLLGYYARTWESFSTAVAVYPKQSCDFLDYYYPMGGAIFRTGLPVPGFFYSPFIAILFAVFPLLGLSASLVLWGILQVLCVSLYLRPARPGGATDSASLRRPHPLLVPPHTQFHRGAG